MDWYTDAKERRAKDPSFGYGKIAKEYGLTYDTVRNKFRRDPDAKKEIAEEVNKEPLDERVYKLLNSGKQFDKGYLCNRFNIPQKVLSATLECLKDDGIQIEETEHEVSIRKIVIPQSNTHDVTWGGEKVIRFGLVGDTHLGSKWEQLDFLQSLYKTYAREGVSKVYHAGDLTDGFYKNRPGHIYELKPDCIGASYQTNHVINYYPDDCDTYYILGNHDETHVMNGGTHIGEIVSGKRKDMHYLGYNHAVINLTPKCKMELVHPKDGSAYAISYSIQRYLDSISGGDKCNISVLGHYHKMFYMFYRNVHAFLPGCLQAQTPFQKGKKLSAHIGGFIVEVHVDMDGTITRCKSEFIPCYKPILPEF